MHLEAVFYLSVVLSPLGQCFLDFNTASFPQTAKSLGTSLVDVQNTLTAYSFGFSIGCFVLGLASDYWGRRLILLSGLSLAILGSSGSALAPNIHFLYITRLIQGLGCGSVCIALGGTLRTMFAGSELRKRTALAAGIGPIIFMLIPFSGSYGQYLFQDWRLLHWFSTILLLVSWIGIFWIYPKHKNSSPIRIQQIKQVITHKGFQKNTLVFSLMLLVYGGYLTLSPSLFLVKWQWSERSFGFVQLFQGGLWIFGAWLNHQYQHYYTPEQWISGCLRFLLFSFILMNLSFLPIFNHPFFFMLTISPIFLCLGPLFSHTFYRTFEPFPTQAGISGALYRSSQFLFYGIGSWVISILPQDSFSSLASVGVSCILMMMLLHHTSYFQNQQLTPSTE